MNLYYCERPDGLYVSTNALALALAQGFGLDPDDVQQSIFRSPWLRTLRTRLGARIRDVCLERPNEPTARQLNAVELWRMTGHISLYISAVFDWLQSVPPLATAGFLDVALGMPWRMCLSAGLQRRAIAILFPLLAAQPTIYGSATGPVRLNNLRHGGALHSATHGPPDP